MDAYDVGPNKSLRPFLPGAPWKNMREFLYEAFADLHRVHVQDYLLRPNSLFDASILSSPSQLKQSLPISTKVILDTATWPARRGMECTTCVLLVPAYTVDDLGVGVGVELCGGEGPPDALIPHRERVLHYIVNNRTGASISLARCGRVYEFGYQQLTTNGQNVSTCLLFEPKLFRNAFERGHVCFDTLERALLRANHCVHDMSVSSGVVKDTTYPYRVTSVRGDTRLRGVVSEYRDAVQLDAMRIAADCDIMRSLSSSDFKHMKSWALSRLFSQVNPVPQCTIPQISQIVEEDNESSSLPDCSPSALLVYSDRATTCQVWDAQNDMDEPTTPPDLVPDIPGFVPELETSLLGVVETTVDAPLPISETTSIIPDPIQSAIQEPLQPTMFHGAITPMAPLETALSPAPEETTPILSLPTPRTTEPTIRPAPEPTPLEAPPIIPAPAPRAMPVSQQSGNHAQQTTSAIPIAPAPARGVMPASGPARITAVQEQQRKRLMRQIRKREAAARSHARRKAARNAGTRN